MPPNELSQERIKAGMSQERINADMASVIAKNKILQNAAMPATTTKQSVKDVLLA